MIWLAAQNIRVIKQFERGVVFRFGRVQSRVRGTRADALIPVADRLHKVNMQIITLPVPAQDGITRDNVTVRVDAVIYFKGRGPGPRRRGCAGLHLGDRAGRADLAALDHRQEQARRPAVQPGAAQPGPRADDRQPGGGLGRPHRPRRDQGRGAARLDEAVHGAAGRGRTGAAGPRHHRRRRTAGVARSSPRPPR